MKHKKLHILLILLCLAISIVSLVFIILTWKYHKKYKMYQSRARENARFKKWSLAGDAIEIAKKVANTVDQEASRSNKDFLEVLTLFINKNSLHEGGGKYAFDKSESMRRLWAAYQGVGSKPHLSCGPRAYLMKVILDVKNISSRVIHCYSVGEKVESHSFLEVLDPKTGHYQCWDPDKARVYKFKDSGKIANIEDLILRNSQLVAYRFKDGNWQKTNFDKLKKNYFSCFIFEPSDIFVGIREGVVIYDKSKFDPDQLAEGDYSFREWVYEKYGKLRFIPIKE